VIYQWVDLDAKSDCVKWHMPKCYGQKPPDSLFVTLILKRNDIEVKVPIKINRKGFYLHFDAI